MITGMLMLRISYQFHHHIKSLATTTWAELEWIYGKPGPSLIFTDFKSVTSFRLTGENPNQEMSKLFTLLERLKASKVELSTQIQAMILLCALPPKCSTLHSPTYSERSPRTVLGLSELY